MGTSAASSDDYKNSKGELVSIKSSISDEVIKVKVPYITQVEKMYHFRLKANSHDQPIVEKYSLGIKVKVNNCLYSTFTPPSISVPCLHHNFSGW